MVRVIWSYVLYSWGGLHRLFGNQNNLPREHERALHYFERAYQVNPNFLQARLARGIILWRELGRIEEAIADFTYLLDQDPNYGPALFNRGLARQEMGRYKLALSDLDAYLALSAEDDYRNQAMRIRQILRDLSVEDE